uniref:Uncharacterized protein n=1 Tax=Rhizophora mucronata TaxID=61149 RepID=A0A2P2N746_RHIMU
MDTLCFSESLYLKHLISMPLLFWKRHWTSVLWMDAGNI